MTSLPEVSAVAARRFVLGKQGLWPGRRWAGKDGARSAMRAVEHLQLDPLVIVARSHDLMLHSRVDAYEPRYFDELTYGERQFFDWGGWLAVRPMDELPYWRAIMRRHAQHRSTAAILAQHPAAVDEMRTALARGERIASRELEASGSESGKTYRGSKARSLALYYLWRTGEAMTYERRGFERVYAATAAVAPAEFLFEADEREAELFLVRKEIAHQGIGRIPLLSQLTNGFGRRFTQADRAEIEQQLLERGELVRLKVAGWRGAQLVPARDWPSLEAVANGRVPKGWAAPSGKASFLSPLDPVVARGRSRELFGVEHVWEIYKRPAEVRFGRFTMPILWEDRFFGRMDAKMDRKSGSLVVNGIWLEDEAAPDCELAIAAVAAEFERLRLFLGAGRVDFTAAAGSAVVAQRLGSLLT